MANGKRKAAVPSASAQKANKLRRVSQTSVLKPFTQALGAERKGSVENLEPKSDHVLRLERAAKSLLPSPPKTGLLLPCRAAERKKVATHLRTGLEKGGTEEVLYISGMPGTGKTAIVMEVLDKLKSQCDFQLVHVNGMRLGSPVQVFREIADQLHLSTTNSQACNDLADMFENRSKADPVIVLLLDEVDCLVTQTQAVLYKVFEWLPYSRMVLAAISNTMDLPERLLPRVASRFKIERVDFAPYTRAQLYEILSTRLRCQQALDAFGDVVLRLCAARVAAATGDIRKALQVCKRAVEIRLQTPKTESPIAIADLEVAEKQLILTNPAAQAVSALTSKARRFLSAIVIELRRKEADAVPFEKAVSRFQKLLAISATDSCRVSCTDSFDLDDAYDSAELLLMRLEAARILEKQAPSFLSETDSAGPLLSLGSLDIEDLTSTLLKDEEDSTIRELLDGARPGTEAPRTFKPVD